MPALIAPGRHHQPGYLAQPIFSFAGKANEVTVFGYDIVFMVANAIAAAGSVEGSAVRDAIENTKDLQVTHFKWTVDKDTHNPMNKPASIFQAKGNKLVFLEKWEPMAN